MINQIQKKHQLRLKRGLRVRKKLQGTSTKPRLCVLKSNAHIHVQLINDEIGHTIGSVSTYSKEFKNTEFNKKNKASAHRLGEAIAEIAKKNDITEVVFDRGSAQYGGVLAALADAARASGLKF
ncbi:MAG: 50S ribosomal protein L18 [Parachlamydiaceae bacterium]|nr:50S ribosomal protein L18 [Parachlamydiaceae bacterium]